MSKELILYLIGACGVLIATIIILLLLINNKKKNKNIEEFPVLLEGLGGLENIENLSLNGSRISINFKVKETINKDLIKDNGVESLVVANKKITLVIGKKAQSVYNYLREQLDK
jgi:phosphotransferase system IIB component